MLIPYRSKNPPESFPYVTITLIAVNVLVYMLTTDDMVEVRKTALKWLAVSYGNIASEPWRIVTAMFLHADLGHILGNMLFLGVFGPAVEGRLRTLRYLTVYFGAGIIGTVFFLLVVGQANPTMPNLGASGAIMGVVGAYLYMFPHTKVLIWAGVFSLMRRRGRPLQWTAKWIIAFYVLIDLLNGIHQNTSGVAHLCHLAGAAVGFILPMLWHVKSDGENETKLMELRQDCNGRYTALTLPELRFAVSVSPEDPAIVTAYVMRAMNDGARRMATEAMHKYEVLLGAQGDAEELAYQMLTLTEYDGVPPPWLMLRVARRLKDKDTTLAEPLLRRVIRSKPTPTGDLLEQSLMLLAEILERTEASQTEATAIYKEVTFRFPLTASATHARVRILTLGAPQEIYFSLQEGKAVPFRAVRTAPSAAEEPVEEPEFVPPAPFLPE